MEAEAPKRAQDGGGGRVWYAAYAAPSWNDVRDLSQELIFCRWKHNRRQVLLAPGKERSGEGDVDSRIQEHLEEDEVAASNRALCGEHV